MMLLLLKLTLAPSLVALATLVARRWGPKAGGILIGFPLSTGPIFIFLAIEHGLEFAQKATIGILFGLVAVARLRADVHVMVSRRTGWVGSLGAAVVSFFAVSAVFSQIQWRATDARSLRLRRASRGCAGCPTAPIPSRSESVTALVGLAAPHGCCCLSSPFSITEVASALGPVLSGIVGTFPVVSTIVVAFTHHQWGRDAAVGMLRGERPVLDLHLPAASWQSGSRSRQ